MSASPTAPSFEPLEEFAILEETRLIDRAGLLKVDSNLLRKAYKVRVLFRLFNPPTAIQYENKSSNPPESFYGYITPIWSPEISTSRFEYVVDSLKIPIKYPSQIVYTFTDDSKLHSLLHYLYHQRLITLLNQSDEPPIFLRYDLAIHPCILTGFKIVLLNDTKGEFILQMYELRASIGGVPVSNPQQAARGLPLPASPEGRDPTPNERDEPGSPAYDGINDNGQTFNPEPPEPPPPEPQQVRIEIPPGTYGVVTTTGQQIPGQGRVLECGQALSVPAPVAEFIDKQPPSQFNGWVLRWTNLDGARITSNISDSGYEWQSFGQPTIIITACQIN